MVEEEKRISPAVVLIPVGLGLAGLLGIFALAWAAPPTPPPEEYVCPHCGAAFATYEELSAHIQTQHPEGYACPYCPDTFATYEELVAHVQSVHPGERIPLPIEWE